VKLIFPTTQPRHIAGNIISHICRSQPKIADMHIYAIAHNLSVIGPDIICVGKIVKLIFPTTANAHIHYKIADILNYSRYRTQDKTYSRYMSHKQ